VDHGALTAFLRSLRRHVQARVLLVWDRLGAHVSRASQHYLGCQGHWLEVEHLPPYAPELNPVEYLWSYLDRTELANFTPDDLAELAGHLQRAARRVRRKPDLAFAFLKHSGLYPEL